jgi:hypothetical protein
VLIFICCPHSGIRGIYVGGTWYAYAMNKIENTTARNLRAGMVLAGSGFTVTHNAWAGVRTPKGRVVVEGFYPGSPVKSHVWNASTTLAVVVG